MFQLIRKYRVCVASVILRNWLNTSCVAADIDVRAQAAELCDQYCLRIFLNWLATKYGFPLYTAAIQSATGASLANFELWPQLANRYPFYKYLPQKVEDLAFAAGFEFLETGFPSQLQLIGSLYQSTLSHPLTIDENHQGHIQRDTKSRTGGEFYTPSPLVNYCLRQAFGESTDSLISKLEETAKVTAAGTRSTECIFKMLDPACGSGNFLLGALLLFQNNGMSGAATKYFLNNCLHGIDVDGRAVQLARIALILAASKYLVDIQAGSGFKKAEQELETLTSQLERNLSVSDATCAPLPEIGFDLVVGNPPYISYGARNQAKVPGSLAKYLRQAYPAGAEYKIRLHSIFQEIAINHAKPGGNIVLLVPDAFLNGSYYRKLRLVLLEKTQICSFSELPENCFPDATAGRWCIAHYRKQDDLQENLACRRDDQANPARYFRKYLTAAKPEYTVNLFRVNNLSENDHRIEPEDSFQIPIAELVTEDRARFQLVFTDLDRRILQKLRQFSPLKTVLGGHTGIRARYGQSSIVSTQKESETFRKGITSGSHVVPHRVDWGGDWLNIVPEKLFAGGFNQSIIESPKLMVRQTADRLIASYEDQGLYHLNNVHSFSPVADGGTNLLFFDGLMNSSLWLHLYQLKSRERNRVLAQIDIEMIESMPLPKADAELERRVAALIGVLRLSKNSDGALSCSLSRAVDRFVYDSYALSEAEIEHIEESIEAKQLKGTLPTSGEAIKLLEFADAPA